MLIDMNSVKNDYFPLIKQYICIALQFNVSVKYKNLFYAHVIPGVDMGNHYNLTQIVTVRLLLMSTYIIISCKLNLEVIFSSFIYRSVSPRVRINCIHALKL